MKLFIIFALILTLEMSNISAVEEVPTPPDATPAVLPTEPDISKSEDKPPPLNEEGGDELIGPSIEKPDIDPGDVNKGVVDNLENLPGNDDPSSRTGPEMADKESDDKNDTTNQPNNDFDGMDAKCQSQIDHCYGTGSPVESLKGKDLKSEGGCDRLASGKACLLEKRVEDICTEDEYKKLEKAICFCPRNVANVVVVAVLCILSKMLSH